MSRLLAALRPTLDPNTADYIDRSVADSNVQQDAKIQAMEAAISALVARQSAHEQTMRELAADLAYAQRDDRYQLTKAKLIRLMRDMGYMDDTDG